MFKEEDSLVIGCKPHTIARTQLRFMGLRDFSSQSQGRISPLDHPNTDWIPRTDNDNVSDS